MGSRHSGSGPGCVGIKCGVNMMESDPSVWFGRVCVIAYHLYKFMLSTSASGHQKYPVDPLQMDLKDVRSSLRCVALHA